MSKNPNQYSIAGKFKAIKEYHKVSKVKNGDGDCMLAVILPTIENIYIKEVIYNNPATIVFWSDGTKTVSKCSAADKYSPETGLLLCCMKRLVGAAELIKVFEDWVPYKELAESDNHTRINLTSIRKKRKVVEKAKSQEETIRIEFLPMES